MARRFFVANSPQNDKSEKTLHSEQSPFFCHSDPERREGEESKYL